MVKMSKSKNVCPSGDGAAIWAQHPGPASLSAALNLLTVSLALFAAMGDTTADAADNVMMMMSE